MVLAASKKQYDAKVELDKLSGSEEGVTRNDFQNFENKILSKVNDINPSSKKPESVVAKPIKKKEFEEEGMEP